MSGWLRGRGVITVAVAGVLALASLAGFARTASRADAAAQVRWWRPPASGIAWQWELDHPLNLRSAADMGLGDKTYLGRPAAAPTVYDIDGFDNTAATIQALHRRHDHVICYIEVGAAENYRPDYGRFPKKDLGRQVPGYPAERYLNITAPAVMTIIKARVAMCARKGFDAIEPDIDDSFTDPTGFRITEAANVSYDARLASYAHSLGLAWGLKNGDTPDFAAQLQPHVDFVLDEQCFQYDTCNAFYPLFARAHKAVLEVEYADQGGPAPRGYCPTALRYGFSAVEFNSALAGGLRIPC